MRGAERGAGLGACTDFASLITYPAEGWLAHRRPRASPGPTARETPLIVDVPFGDALIRELHDEMGITIGSVFAR